MHDIPFLFSNKKKYWLARHVTFWVVTYVGLASVGVVMPSFFSGEANNRFREYFLVPVLYLPAQLFLVYSLLYFVIPRYLLRLKYRQAFLWVIFFSIVAGVIAAVFYSLFIDSIRIYFFQYRHGGKLEALPIVYSLSSGFINGLRYALTVSGFAAAIKLMKHWYEKEYRNSILQKEKLNAELVSLKAQLHPHFLFNTLNNIYSITENVSPLASEMLVKLSDMLRYILYECNLPLVKLSQEIKLIQDYIELEKIRYTRSLDLDMSLPDNPGTYMITPLLLLPLAENCFKHGSSKLLEQAWIKIQVELKENMLHVKMINGKPASEAGKEVAYGIGLGNLQKRLDLLYPGKYEFKIISEEEVFVVNLKLELEKQKETVFANG
ncbi:MAG: histidine kinase [Bacteroidota bacterium]|nr:histidine kinase [Bacteroidota bacterium]